MPLVTHVLEPVWNADSRVLILGTIPSPKSRELGFYYGHPQNRFWPVLSQVLGRPLPQTNEEKRQLCLENGVALWDVLASCDIQGASDSSIRNAKVNDFSHILAHSAAAAIFTTGRLPTAIIKSAAPPAMPCPSSACPPPVRPTVRFPCRSWWSAIAFCCPT